ncbi:MAG: 1-deoxy-D-xylulose-5-phosphate reductoisomerase [Paludibacteraceae bacterium]|nr:1-deoxy-D-xylulose-5-phosphate reductoisomerase [Paludibacteraceae bacterium]
MVKNLCILGSTGSIGTQTLDIVRAYPERYSVYAICANRSVDKLVEQALEFHPEVVCIADESLYEELKEKLSTFHTFRSFSEGDKNFQLSTPKVWAGADAIAELVTMPSIDIVVASMVGYAGLRPTIEAIKAGKTIALANKETLVVAGEIICELAQQYHTPILPVDSEHSAIFQSLVGEDRSEIEKILLTASGGPFRTFTLDQMRTVTAADALKHPNWEMGAKITIDSASMMNKGFEVMEAKWLFGVPVEKIQVLVHPQSIVHSAVQFTDGAIKAQLGAPDMHLPIQYALSFPERLASDFPRADLFALKNLTFEQPDLVRFPNLALAYEAMHRGGNIPCVLNAANEVVNLAFRQGRCGFLQMSDIIAETMNQADFIPKPTYEDYVATDTAARRITEKMVNGK